MYQEPEYRWSTSDISHTFYYLSLYFIIPVSLICLFFTGQFADAAAITVLLKLILKFFVFLENHVVKKTWTFHLKDLRRWILIGSGISMTLGWIPRIWVFVEPENTTILWYLNLLILPTISFTWATFVARFKNQCNVYNEFEDKASEHIEILHAFSLLSSVLYSITYTNGFIQILITQIWYYGICVNSMLEFCQAYRWKIKLVNALLGDNTIMSLETSKKRSVSLPDVIQSLHFVIVPISIVIGLLYLIFSELTIIKFSTAGYILMTWFFNLLIVVGIEKCIKSAGADLLAEFRNKILIGWAGSMFFGWIPRIMVFIAPISDKYDDAILAYTILVSLPTISLFWSVFIARYKTECEVSYNEQHRPWLILIYNTIILLFALKFGTLYEPYNIKRIKWINIAFFPICTSSMMEFFHVWSGNLRLMDVEEPQKSVQNPSSIIPSAPLLEDEDSDSHFVCQICMEKFNSMRIPRLLKECGHTICEDCADNLLRGKQIVCPFCQEITVVNGSAKCLPKNFTIADLVEEKRTWEVREVLI